MRLCVQIDLSIAVVGKFNLNGSWYYVEYKGLHILCVECGCYGHVARNYTKAEMKTTEDGHGSDVLPLERPNPSSGTTSAFAIKGPNDVMAHGDVGNKAFYV